MRIETKDGWHGAATIKTLIRALEQCPPESMVEFSFCGAVPTKVSSYRGYYEFGALGWEQKYPGPTVSALLLRLKGSLGLTMTGWKGGEYTISPDKPLFIDNPGETNGTGIVAVETDEEPNGYTILVTAKVD